MWRELGDDRIAGQIEPAMGDHLRAEEFDALDPPRETAASIGGQFDELGPDAEADRAIRHFLQQRQPDALVVDTAGVGDSRQDVDPGLADETRDLDMGWIVVDRFRRGELQQMAADHHRDTVGHRKRLGLVVRHIERRHAGPAVQFDDLAARMDAQIGVEIGKRLVHQEDRGLAHHGARQRDALTLAARHLPRLAVEQLIDLEHARHLAHIA